ncbi:hypothetical protein B4123_4266 [Bacillus paralicheniformis]|nr:hypothetical protein LI6934_11730 [Bacillus licheniformis LMG 6934]OLG03013.1 hypothetical protein B4123_4266 [Bacillus paralicheniformis]TWJ53775.1 hypothetical protein CHCC5023_2905 [Bacillus paralicheniformis]TWJ73771.1 hypothetical protein CHCC5019_1017 [Bacillus paralicheniformis]TWN99342.1 hypothetical protein CHCC20490_2586 [Bacillus paralicheniformis]
MLNISCMPTPPLYQHMKKGEAGAGFHARAAAHHFIRENE